MSYASEVRKRERKMLSKTPHKSFVAGKGIGKYQGVMVGGKKYTRFSQIKTASAGRATTKQRTARGIGLAIL